MYLRRVEEEADSLIPYMCGVYIQKRPVGAAARAAERHVGGGGAFGKDPECGDGPVRVRVMVRASKRGVW